MKTLSSKKEMNLNELHTVSGGNDADDAINRIENAEFGAVLGSLGGPIGAAAGALGGALDSSGHLGPSGPARPHGNLRW